MTIKVTYNVTDVYVTQDVSPVYINVSYSSGSSGGAVWGGITGTLSDQTDLKTALDAKVPYSGATANVDLGEYELKAGQVEFDQTPTGTAGVSVMRWNDSDGTLDLGLKGGNVTLQLGQEQVARVVNKSGVNLLESAYQVVKVTDAQGQRLAVDLAQANNDANSADTLGIVTENIDNNLEGFITTSGIVRNINTTGSLQGETWNDGDVLYLSPTTAGAITNIKPTAPNHLVTLGYVVYAHANNGKIFVKPNNGYELGELHDVYVPTPSNNDGIFWNSTNLRYENKTVSSALGYTPANSATTLTINGVTYDLSANRSWTISAGISGSGASGQVAYWTGASAQSGSNNLFWDAANSRLGIGTATPSVLLHVRGSYAGALDNLIPQMLFENANTTAGADLFALSRIRIGNGYLGGYPEIWVQALRTASNVGTINLRVVSNHALLFSTNDAERMRIFAGGNLALGSTTDSGERLQVTGNVRVNGTLTSTSDISASGNFIRAGWVATPIVGRESNWYISFTNANNGGVQIVQPNFASGTPNGNVNGLSISYRFGGNTSTFTNNSILIDNTINQVSGTGITRGLYINPTLTAATDYRAIETTNGKVIFGNLPTSSAGLPTGAIWNDAGTLKIV